MSKAGTIARYGFKDRLKSLLNSLIESKRIIAMMNHRNAPAIKDTIGSYPKYF